MRQSNAEGKVNSFRQVLEKLTANLALLEDQHRTSVEQSVSKTNQLYEELNVRILDLGKNIKGTQANMQVVKQDQESLRIAEQDILQRIFKANSNLESLTQEVRLVQQTKETKQNFAEQRREMKVILDSLLDRQDENKNRLTTMEHFIDKYVPIRMQQQIGETLEAVINRTMIVKLESFEMQKYKSLNEDVLDDETQPDLKERALGI